MKYLKLFFLLVFFTNIYAEAINTGHAEVSLVKFNTQSDGNKKLIGIKMDMQTNWHTYWKNPGDSGGPIKVSWKADENITFSSVMWPAPQLIPYDPLMTYGYKDFVIFPFEYSKDDNLNSNIEVFVDFLICDDICVPENAYIQTSLNQISEDYLLYDWFKKVPLTTLPIIAKSSGDFLEIRFSNNNDIKNIYFFNNDPNLVKHASKQILTKEENNWLLKVPLVENYEDFKTIKGVLSINNDENYLIEENFEIGISSTSSISFFQAVIFAFIGGLILNLMPCVFPIISLKILSFVALGNESSQKIRQHALSFCFGVLVSFFLIGLALIGLKEAGNYVGWGFQLQSPIIVGILSILMFLIGVVLLTDINIGSSMTKLGAVGSSGISGSFLTGVLAVIVASPCTAPFMGAALGYALIQSSNLTMPIFISLGIGFAAPYFILSMYPQLINKLPKPGQWMVTLKEFFAFPMFATSLWLIWVFSLQTNSELLISLLISLLIISLLFWLIIKFNKKVITIVSCLSILTVIFVQAQKIQTFDNEIILENEPQNQNKDFKIWSPDIEEIFKQENQAYLINFTAAWCITCQANDKIALSRPKIKKYLNENNVEYVVADWTNKDAGILKALESYERNGVPLYVYWKPGMKESLILPAILTEKILLDSF